MKISRKKLDNFGAVSPEISKDMAFNVKKLFNSDIGISTTGIAGPKGGSKDKKVGLVYIGICYKNICIAKKFNFNLNRDMNRKITCYVALNIIRKIIND